MTYYKCGSIHPTQNSNVVVDTASGAIANFSTQFAMPLIKSRFNFKATQEAGTPTPQSPKAISGVSAVNVVHCRKNLLNLDYLTASGITIQTGEASATALIFANAFGLNTNGIPSIKFSSNKSYSVSLKAYTSGEGTTEGTGLYIAFVYTDGTRDMLTIPNNQQAFDEFSKTSNANKTVSKICFGYQSGYANVWHLKDIQIEENSEATVFEPYNGSTTLINLGGTYYGGYVSQDRDGHRELVVTHNIKLFSELDFRRSNSGGSWSSYVFFAQMSDKTIKSAVKCSNYDYVTQSIASMQNKTITSGSSNEYIYIRDDNYTTVEAFKTANANTQLWYELAEPFTVALPDGQPIKSFPGINNIYADTGDTSLQFRKIG